MKKRIIAILLAALTLSCCFALNAFAAKTPSLLVDEADVLTDAEEIDLRAELETLSDKREVDFVFVTVESLGGEDPGDFAEAYFHDNGYGRGEDKDGVMLLFSAEVVDGGRDYYIYYSGICFDAINDDVESVKSAVVGYLKNDDFVKAVYEFTEESARLLDIEINGAPFAFGKSLIISLVIGFVIALISVSVMKGKLKSVRFQSGASTYQKVGSLMITNSRDVFLYRNVTRRARPKSTSGGGAHGGGSRSGGSGGKC